MWSVGRLPLDFVSLHVYAVLAYEDRFSFCTPVSGFAAPFFLR